jgi:hypothetical protein
MSKLSEEVTNLFFLNTHGALQAQFYSATACALIEKELADAQICYKTTITKSKKRGLVYVIALLEPLPPSAAVEPSHG